MDDGLAELYLNEQIIFTASWSFSFPIADATLLFILASTSLC